MIRIALIGLGGISQSVHLPVLQRNRATVDVVAAVELSPLRLQRLSDRYGIAHRYTSVAELVAAIESGLQVDAAILATGGTHAADALTLIQAGVRVLSEKPLAYSFKELATLEAGLKAAGREPHEWLRVGYMKEYDPAVAAALQELEGKQIRQVSVEVLHPADGAQLAFARLESAPDDVSPEAVARGTQLFDDSIDSAIGAQVPDRQRRLFPGVVLGSIVHDIALTRHLDLGLDKVIHAAQWTDQFPGSVTAIGATKQGAPWVLGWHFIVDYPEYRERVTVHHESGTIELEFKTPYILNAPTVLTVRSQGAGFEHSVQERTWPQDEAFERELHALAKLASGEPQSGSSLDEARADLITAMALWNAITDSAGVNPTPGTEATAQRA